MNSKQFAIDYDWQVYPDSIPELGYTSARVKISIGDWNATENINRESRTTNESVYLSLYPYALWTARSWWRLLYETAKPEPSSEQEPLWRLAHDLTSSGEGFVWPDLEYASDGMTMQIVSYKTAYSKAAIDYLNAFSACIPLADFEQAHRQLIETVCERLREYSFINTDLHQYWNAITSEYQDDKAKRYRILEARLGFDPDEADPGIIEMLLDKEQSIGSGCLAELASSSLRRDSASSLLENLGVFERRLDSGIVGKLSLPKINVSRLRRKDALPWKIGYAMAEELRRVSGISTSAIGDGTLAELLGISQNALFASSDARKVSLARLDEQGNARFSFQRGPVVGRRFNAARIIADSLLDTGDNWLAATTATTYRQKIQRSFAGELLCPIDELQNFISVQEPDVDTIEEAAEHFNVSPFVPALQLHNRGLLPHALKEVFGWEDKNFIRGSNRRAA